MSLISTIKEDNQYKKAIKILEGLEQLVNPDLLIKELRDIQISRNVVSLKTKKLMQNATKIIADSSLDEIGSRSRATTIKVDVLTVQMDLNETYSYLKRYLMTKYAKQLKKAGYSRVNDQKMFIERLLKNFISLKENLETVMKVADVIIEDVDAAGWGLKRISETLEQLSRDR